ncbi:MAG: general secretion pathway protein GspB [Geobacteraceae bacterium]|jgi:general secretion pathway protein B
MSSILKALKRIEQQKLVRKAANHDIAWIVRGEDFRPEKKRQWLMFVSLVAVALLAVLSTYWFMGGFHEPSRDSLTRPGEEARPSSGIPPVAVLAPPQPSRTDPPPVSTPDSAALPPAVVNRSAKKGLRDSSKDLFLKSDRQGGESQALAPPRVPQAQAALPPRPEPVPAPQPPKSSLPALTVTGIAWEKDSPVHLAIVNGTSVVEGSMVNGVRVEKILPDRVRFTFENRSFEVHLNQGEGGN